MKKMFFAALAMAFVLPAAAQDTYESARLLGSDLNGTARYVGMGGAMEALGADISTMSTNPAGIGLFRHSTASLGFGFQSQAEAKEFDGLGKTNMSFDQLGFVYSAKVSPRSIINVGFNYHKSKNFDQILSAANSLNNCSQNGLTYHKATLGDARHGGYTLDFNKDGDVIGWDGDADYRAYTFNEADYLNSNVLLLDPDDEYFYYNNASQYSFDRAHRGWIADYDFNLSGNYNDRFYWGFTVGVKDVHYKGYSEYAESLVDSNGPCGSVSYGDERKITGTGVNIKAGVIVRPLEESPFRVGAYIHTPTWYELTSSNSSVMYNNTPSYGAWDDGRSQQSYDFAYHTPWLFGLSMGTTIGSNLAIGAGYEFTDYAASQNRIIDGYDYYDNAETSKDVNMKHNTEQSLKSVSTFKVGAEYKPVPDVALRLGYNYVSSGYNMNGVRDMTVDSPGTMYASTTDYVNWKDTQRLTCGVGFKVGKMNIDLAYHFSKTDGEFHPFQQYDAGQNTGVSKVTNKRNQALLTLGYTF
ncbi:MAG: hemin receptor [Prevotella sp.]|nr:hemin receptor [Prevotella sp.]